jgi:hypothetical protein
MVRLFIFVLKFIGRGSEDNEIEEEQDEYGADGDWEPEESPKKHTKVPSRDQQPSKETLNYFKNTKNNFYPGGNGNTKTNFFSAGTFLS